MKNKFLIFILLFLITLGFNAPSLVVPSYEGKESIKVMTYNIHQYYVEDEEDPIKKTGEYVFDELLSIIKQQDPDILALQESEGSRFSSGNQNGVYWLANKLNMYYFYGPSTSDQIYGVSLLSKWKITESEWKMLPAEESIERVIIRCLIESPFGNLIVYNTHFQTGSYKLDQKNQAEFVVDYVGDDKAIIMGDFNVDSLSNDEGYHIMNNSFTYAWIEDGNHPNATSGFTAPAGDPSHKIDFIWLSENDWEVIANSVKVVGDDTISDHRAVVANILMANN